MNNQAIEMNHHEVSLIGIERLRYLTDGPGITTLVGFHGCPLNCAYCINPQCHDYSTLYQYTPSSLIEELKRDGMYFSATGGGVTFGGGEPLLYPSFIKEFRKQAPDDWAINVETSLNISLDILQQLIPVIDHYIIDIKETNPVIYKRYTGRDNSLVIENLKFLLDNSFGNKIEVRVPEIPEYNTDKDIYKSIVLLKQMGVDHISFLTYKVGKVSLTPSMHEEDNDKSYGKSLCKILRNIRVEKAKELGVDYTPAICTNKKACSGTCPVCEKELEYIISFYQLNNK